MASGGAPSVGAPPNYMSSTYTSTMGTSPHQSSSASSRGGGGGPVSDARPNRAVSPGRRRAGQGRANGSGVSVSISVGGSGSAEVRHRVDDDAVVRFCDAIDRLPSDEWRARTLAFEQLVDFIPAERGERDGQSKRWTSGTVPWYRSPATLRRLALPLRDLLGDGRSTVVRHTCDNLSRLIARVAVINGGPNEGDGNIEGEGRGGGGDGGDPLTPPPQSDVARYLLKDLLPAILALHGQTVNLIRGYALAMMLDVIPRCRFKSGLPTILERLRRDKSRDVREACARYVRAVMESWTKSVGGGGDAGSVAGKATGTGGGRDSYITRDIALHIGNALARALTDPSQCVRMEARVGFETFRSVHSDVWSHIVRRADGPLSKDLRVKKSVINAAVRADAERSLGIEGGSRRVKGKDENRGLVANDDASVVSNHTGGFSFVSTQSRTSRTSVGSSSRASGIPALGTRGGKHRHHGTGYSKVGSIPRQIGARKMVSPPPGNLKGTMLSRSPPATPQQVHFKGDEGQGGLGPTDGGGGPTFPFPDALRSPDPSSRKDSELIVAGTLLSYGHDTVPPLPSPTCTNNIHGDVTRHRAATSIQAAARGVVMRKRILMSFGLGAPMGIAATVAFTPATAKERTKAGRTDAEYFSTPPPVPTQQREQPKSRELEMLQEARMALGAHNLGVTARLMADRRKTIGGEGGSGIVPPALPSPGNASFSSAHVNTACQSPSAQSMASAVATPATDRRVVRSKAPGSGGLEWGGTPKSGAPPLRGPRSFTFNHFTPPPRSVSTSDVHSPMAAGTPFSDTTGTGTSYSQSSAETGTPVQELGTVASRLLTLKKAGANKSRERRATIMLQERLRGVAFPLPGGGELDPSQASSGSEGQGQEGILTASLSHCPEHLSIAEELLAAHKSSMDELMQTLRVEMDVLRDFELMIRLSQEEGENSQSGRNRNNIPSGAAKRPTNEDVLDYFECVALCIDERTDIGEKLCSDIDRIGRGEKVIDDSEEEDHNLRARSEEEI